MNFFDPLTNLSIDTTTNSFDQTQHDFDRYVDSTYDTSMNTFSNTGGYNEAYFGNDPLSKVHQYECPKFTHVNWVDSYIRTDGTFVEGHWRSNPDDVTWNNLKP